MNKAYLLTGGNLGDRVENLNQAKLLIAEHCGKVVQSSSIYETAAWGNEDQPSFLNQVLVIETKLEAEKLMQDLLHIEALLGRQRLEKYGPRIIDIDILFFNNDIIESKLLTVPHPRIQERRFVLTPLHELSPAFIHPIFKTSIHNLLNDCSDQLNVKKFSLET